LFSLVEGQTYVDYDLIYLYTIPSPKLKWNECGFCSTVGAIKHTTENPQKPWLLFYHSCSASSLR